jgi:diaminopimelate decarboxylase
MKNNLRNSLKREKTGYTYGGQEIEPVLKNYGTPVYIYDANEIRKRLNELRSKISWPSLKLFYAMKANNNPHLLTLLCDEGTNIDAVSEGEVLLALSCGFTPDRILFTANHISNEEADRVADLGVMLNIGSLSRLERYGKRHPHTKVCIRFNPDVVAGEFNQIQTGGSLTKFGILLEEADEVKALADRYDLTIAGIHKHTGSGIANTSLFLESMGNLMSVGNLFPNLEFVDFGGGFKVPYEEGEKLIDYKAFGKEVVALFGDFCRKYGRELMMYFEPGKYLVAESGILVVQVNTLKKNRGRLIAGTDSGFPQLIRPTYYGAYHSIINLTNPQGMVKEYDVVGNICESGDVFARNRKLPEIREGDYLAILNGGAYCFSMGSIYNFRALPAEVLIDGDRVSLIRKRLSPDEMIARIREEALC